MRNDPFDDAPYAPEAATGWHAETHATHPHSHPEPAPPAHAHRDAFDEGPRGERWWTDPEHLRQWAYAGGLLGGVLILVGAFALALLVTIVNLVGAGDSDVWFFDEDAFPGVAIAVSLWGLLSGGLAVVGALRIKDDADASALPGGMILFGGLLSFFALGGFLVGGLAAIVGGVMGIAAARRLLPERRARTATRGRPMP